MKPVGKPDAGNPHVRFDERGGETGLRHRLENRAPPRLHRSWGASGTPSSTPTAAPSWSSRTRRASRTGMGVGRSSKPPVRSSPSWPASSPMAGMIMSASRAPPASSSRSSASCPIRSALPSCRAGGWSSASSPGSTATADSPRISKPQSPPPEPSSTPLPSCCSFAASRGTHDFRNRL